MKLVLPVLYIMTALMLRKVSLEKNDSEKEEKKPDWFIDPITNEFQEYEEWN